MRKGTKLWTSVKPFGTKVVSYIFESLVCGKCTYGVHVRNWELGLKHK
jgi:hypothetical protein